MPVFSLRVSRFLCPLSRPSLPGPNILFELSFIPQHRPNCWQMVPICKPILESTYLILAFTHLGWSKVPFLTICLSPAYLYVSTQNPFLICSILCDHASSQKLFSLWVYCPSHVPFILTLQIHYMAKWVCIPQWAVTPTCGRNQDFLIVNPM